MTEVEPQEGSCCPLGASWVSSLQAYNFALYTQHATAVTLLLYKDRNDAERLVRAFLPLMASIERSNLRLLFFPLLLAFTMAWLANLIQLATIVGHSRQG